MGDPAEVEESKAAAKPAEAEEGKAKPAEAEEGKAAAKPAEVEESKAAAKPAEAEESKAAAKPAEAEEGKAKPAEAEEGKATAKPAEVEESKAAAKPAEAEESKAALKTPKKVKKQRPMKTMPHTLALPGAALSFADVSVPMFRHLRTLDLSRNQLRSITGLASLRYLQHIDCSLNPELAVDGVLSQLAARPAKCTSLLSVACAPSQAVATQRLHRVKVLRELGHINRQLTLVEGQPASADERYESAMGWHQAGQLEGEVRHCYKGEVVITEAFAPAATRVLHPSVTELARQQQFNVQHVGCLVDLSRRGLRDANVPRLDCMSNLYALDLSGNQLTTITGLGIELLKGLRALDVSNNSIAQGPAAFASVLNQLPLLAAVAVRGNPGMASPTATVELLSALKTVDHPDAPLFICDRVLSSDDKVQAFKSAHQELAGNKKQLQQALALFRANVMLAKAKPLGLAVHEVKELVLPHRGFTSCPTVSSYAGLQKLILRGNRITTLAGSGLEALTALRVLDLRDNRIKLKGRQLASLLQVLNQVTSLAFLGLAGNPKGLCNSKPIWKLVGQQLTSLRDPASPLRLIDDTYMSIDRVLGLCQDVKDGDRFRFELALTRRRPREGVDSAAQVLVKDPCHIAVLAKHADPAQPAPAGAATGGRVAVPRATSSDAVGTAAHLMIDAPPQVPAEKVASLNLAAQKLTTADLAAFTGLVELNLSHNLLDMRLPVVISCRDTLTALDLSHNSVDGRGVASLQLHFFTALKTLNIRHNNLHDRSKTFPPLQQLSSLTDLSLHGNPCFKTDSAKHRQRFLGNMTGMQQRGAALVQLNGRPISTSERCKALAVCKRDPELSRLDLLLEEAGVKEAEAEVVDLQKKRLVNVAQLAHMTQAGMFGKLHTVVLAGNHLATLQGQGLHMLTGLTSLDLSHNRLPSVAHIVQHLHRCAVMNKLKLKGSTGRSDTSSPDKYAEEVFTGLRGLDDLDGLPNPHPLTDAQHSAIAFLAQHAGASTNDIRVVDMRGRGMCHQHFPWVIAALAELPVERVLLSDNPWSAGVGKHFTDYRRFVIAGMGGDLLSVDGVPITDDERANSLVFVKADAQRYGSYLKKGGWMHVRSKAERAMAKYPRQASHPPKTRDDNLMPTIFSTSRAAAAEAKASEGKGEDGELNEAATGKQADKSKTDQRLEAAGNMAAGKATGTAGGGGGVAVDIAITAATAVTGVVTGSLLTKLELAITFFQVYGLVLSIPVDIQWPDAWLSFAGIYNIIPGFMSIDIDVLLLTMDVPVPAILKEYLSFIAMMLVMGCFLAIYIYASSMSRKAWISSYHRNWQRTRKRAVWIWLLLLLISVATGFVLDWDATTTNISNGKAPTGRTIGIIATCAATTTLPMLAWLILVLAFRSKYRGKDGQVGGTAFLVFWSKMKRTLQRVSLFFMTVLFMPAAKLILRTFAPNVKAEDLGSCPYQDASGQQCCLLIQPTEACLGSPQWSGPTTQQLLAIPFLILYVVLLPVFFIWLVKKGVHEVYVGGYKHRRQVHKQKMAAIRAMLKRVEEGPRSRAVAPQGEAALVAAEIGEAGSGSGSGSGSGQGEAKGEAGSKAKDASAPKQKYTVKELKAALKAERKRIDRVYTFEVQQNPKAQTYLYQPYTYKSRYQKVVIMIFKLVVVMIALFAVPIAGFAQLPFAVSGASIFVNLFWVAFRRPFQDATETLQELSSGATNLVNVLVALGIGREHIPDNLATLLLIAFNGLNLLLIVCLLIAAPLMVCHQKRAIKRAREAEKQRLAALGIEEEAKAEVVDDVDDVDDDDDDDDDDEQEDNNDTSTRSQVVVQATVEVKSSAPAQEAAPPPPATPRAAAVAAAEAVAPASPGLVVVQDAQPKP